MYISIDMGGTNTRIAISKNLKNIDKVSKFGTKQKLVDQKNHINYQIKKITDNQDVKAICIGVPGTIDIIKKEFIRLPNYKELNNKPFDALLGDNYKNIETIISNDANIAGYKEALEGAGKDYTNVLYITIGTGIGGVLVKDKNINDVFENFEPGHEVLFNDGLDFEDHCSGKGFRRIHGIAPSSKVSQNIWKEYAKELDKGLSYLQKKYNPDLIVLGGGVSEHNFKYFGKYLNTNVKLSEFGDDAGLLGGFLLIRNS